MNEPKLSLAVSTILQKNWFLWTTFIVSFLVLSFGTVWTVLVILQIYAAQPTSAFIPVGTICVGIVGIALSFVLLYVKKECGVDLDTLSKIRGEKIIATDGNRHVIIREINTGIPKTSNEIEKEYLSEKVPESTNEFAKYYGSPPKPKPKRKYTKRKKTEKETKKPKVKKIQKKSSKKKVKTKQVKKTKKS